MTWNWQQSDWPRWRYDLAALETLTDEAAAILGISTALVRQRRLRARRALGKILPERLDATLARLGRDAAAKDPSCRYPS